MRSNIKGIIATSTTCAIIIGGYFTITFQGSCLDICILDRWALGILTGLLGAILGLAVGLVLAALSWLKVCTRSHHFIIASTMLWVNFIAIVSLILSAYYSILSTDRLLDIAIGALMGTVFALASVYKRSSTTAPQH